MAVRIRYDESLEEKVQLRFSAVEEACFALHCFVCEEPHKLQRSWVCEMQGRLPERLLKEIGDFGHGSSDQWYAPPFLFGRSPFAPVEHGLARARALTRDELLRDPGVPGAVDRDPAPAERELEAARQFERDPEGWRDRACELLEAFWPYFLPTWAQLERGFARKLQEIEARRQRGERLFELLPTLASPLAWDPDSQEIVVASRIDMSLSPGELTGFGVRPSFFSIPHPTIYVGLPEFDVVIWTPNALVTASRVDAEDLAGSLNTLADATRLKILALLLAAPRSAREIGEALELSSGAVARHLRALSGMDAIRAIGKGESGEYARYEANRSSPYELMAELGAFLEQY